MCYLFHVRDELESTFHAATHAESTFMRGYNAIIPRIVFNANNSINKGVGGEKT